jgi:riboflavin synthase
MFTGLIETVGTITAMPTGGSRSALQLTAPLPMEEIRIGDSIAVNGACLTVTAMQSNSFSFDVSPETLACTILGRLTIGSRVNLERAMQLGGRLDGHLVTGHIDCIATLDNRISDGNAQRLFFSLPPEHAGMLVPKGSVTVNGISLTINNVTENGFDLAVIPHTLTRTNLTDLMPGQQVNIETDLIGKYIARLLAPRTGGAGLTMEKLLQNGFI